MPSLVIPDTIEVTVSWTTGPLLGVNVMHVRTDDPDGDVVTAAETFRDWINADYKAITPGSTTFTGVRARSLDSVGAPDHAISMSTAGTDPGDALPPNATVCVTLRTGLNTGRGRGRVYTPPQTQGVVDDYGTILSGRRTDIVSRFETLQSDLQTALAATNGDLAVASRADLVSRVVTAVTIDPVIDTQRRRLHN